jgi:hypothetical protein
MEKPIILDGYHIIRCFDLEAMSLPKELSELTDPPENDSDADESR